MTTDAPMSTEQIASMGAASEQESESPRLDEPAVSHDDAPTALLPSEDVESLNERWQAIQIGFVDTPRESVEQADELVADLMQRLARMFADERARLEAELSKNDSMSTEDLRVALQRYRSFFHRLLIV